MKRIPLPLSLLDYQSIFRVLYGTHEHFNAGERPSCQFYNVVGAYILRDIYGIKAYPRMGAAFIKVDEATGHALAFAHPDFRYSNSDSKHFHCWVETETHYIDFTAPVYGDYPSAIKINQRFMFQKPKLQMSYSHLELEKAGDFFFDVNLELTKAQLQVGANSTSVQDFAGIAMKWAKDSKKALLKKFTIQSDTGERITLKASEISVSGAW